MVYKNVAVGGKCNGEKRRVGDEGFGVLCGIVRDGFIRGYNLIKTWRR